MLDIYMFLDYEKEDNELNYFFIGMKNNMKKHLSQLLLQPNTNDYMD